MRLTYKEHCSLNIDEDISGEYCPNSSLNDCIEKLGQLEDIEEELGIDLLTLFKVLKYGIFDKQGKYYYPHLEYIDDEHRKEWMLIEEQGDYRPDIWFHFKDYGKTWALTKEALQ